MSTRAYAAFQAICKHAEELADIGQQEAKEHTQALDWCRAELEAIQQLCHGAGLEGSVIEMVQAMARAMDAERHLRDAHKLTVDENMRLRGVLAVVDNDFALAIDAMADGNRVAHARQRIRDALKGKVTT